MRISSHLKMFAISHVFVLSAVLLNCARADFESRLASLENLVFEQNIKMKTLGDENKILHQQIANMTSPFNHMTSK